MYAHERGIPERTLRRRAKGLHAQQGNVLKSAGVSGKTVRKWLLNREAFEIPLPEAPAIEEIDQRLRKLEAGMDRLRGDLIRTRKRLPK